MQKKLHILILDDVLTDAELMAFELSEAGIEFEPCYASDMKSFMNAIDRFLPDIVLSDYSLPSFDGLSALKIVKAKYPDVPFIFVTGALGEELAIELMKKGATDYVLKSRMSRLAPAVIRAMQEVEEKIERKRAEQKIIKTNEMLRSITSELIMTEERERRRIAVDLHDNIAQTLAITKLKLDSLLDGSDDDKTASSLEEIIDLIEQAIGQTRSLMTDLSPSVLYELGLTEAMEWLGEQIQERHGLRIILKKDPKIRNIDKDLQALLFRSTRELLLNVIKHAQAKEAFIFLQKLPGQISVSVKDNGRGFNIKEIDNPSRKNGGFGLLSIRERLNHIGGIFEIETEKGQGTCIRLIVPEKKRSPKGKKKIES